MKLILTSNGFANTAIVEKCVELVGKPAEDINFAVINEAYAVEQGDHSWILDDFNRIKSYFKGRLEFVNLLALDIETVKSRIGDADVIFVIGGHTDYLMSVFKKTGFDKSLSEFLQSKVYVCVSAGSMVIGKRISTEAYLKIYSEGRTYGVTEYTGIVDIALKPHIGSPYFPNNIPEKLCFASAAHDGIVYGLSDDAAVVVNEDNHYLIGGEYIKIKNGTVEYESSKG